MLHGLKTFSRDYNLRGNFTRNPLTKTEDTHQRIIVPYENIIFKIMACIIIRNLVGKIFKYRQLFVGGVTLENSDILMLQY